jgi:hypothetical protein
MHIKLRYFIATIVLGLHACAPNGSASVKVNVLPEVCQVQTGGQIALTLNGQIPANTNVHWEASLGKVVWTEQGLTATYIAPDTPGDAVISVSFVSATPSPFSTSRICTVAAEAPPSPPNIPGGMPSMNDQTVVISEVMGHPCGDLESKKFNQYVELYNYGDQPVDVGGWWLFDEGEKGTPDQLTTWDSRSKARLDPSLVTNSSVIPPHGFAIVLSPIYPESYAAQRMPYQFPGGTIMLTVAASQTLGDDFFGIISAEEGRDTVTLYIGGATVMNQVVDTYGTPLIDSAYPTHINDDRFDHLPLYLHECESAERINPLLPDQESNWAAVKGGSPGEGPY